MNLKSIMLICFSLVICYFAGLSQTASIHQPSHLKFKRSPFLRLDELSTKIYLAKNKLGGGLIDPLEIGKRSSRTENILNIEPEANLALSIFDGLKECLSRDECSSVLSELMDQ